MLALKMASNGSLFEPGTRCNILDSAVTGHNLEPGSFGITTRATLSRDWMVLDHFTKTIASLSEKMISLQAKWWEGSKPFFACGTIFDNLKNEKNAKRYTERKISENSSVSVVAMISSNICSVNMEFVLTKSGLFILQI